MDESELLAQLRAGHDVAFEDIFRAHYSSLVGAAARLVGSRFAAEEIAQDVMLELWRRRESLTITGSLRGYLHQAVRNRALNRLRQERTAREAEPFVRPPAAAAATDGATGSRELREAVSAAIAALSEPQREVFLMSREDGLTYPEIAGLLGISVKTVEARMGRALRALRTALAEWLPEGGGW